jgi:hypothetical protein
MAGKRAGLMDKVLEPKRLSNTAIAFYATKV